MVAISTRIVLLEATCLFCLRGTHNVSLPFWYRHLQYKQTGYDRCDSSHCLYSLLGIKYGFNMLEKKKMLTEYGWDHLFARSHWWHLWFYLLTTQLWDGPIADPALTFTATSFSHWHQWKLLLIPGTWLFKPTFFATPSNTHPPTTLIWDTK